MIGDGDAERLQHALESLDAQTSDAIRRAIGSGLSYADLARYYGVPEATIREKVRRGLLHLRQSVDARGG